MIRVLDRGVVVQLFRQRRTPSASLFLPDDSFGQLHVWILAAQLPRKNFLATFDASSIFMVICAHESLGIVFVVRTLNPRSI